MFVQWHRDAEKQLFAQGIVQFNKPVSVQADFYFANNIRTDLDNKLSSILDLFTDINIIEDDRWQCVSEIKLTGQLDKNNPHTIIKLEEL